MKHKPASINYVLVSADHLYRYCKLQSFDLDPQSPLCHQCAKMENNTLMDVTGVIALETKSLGSGTAARKWPVERKT